MTITVQVWHVVVALYLLVGVIITATLFSVAKSKGATTKNLSRWRKAERYLIAILITTLYPVLMMIHYRRVS